MNSTKERSVKEVRIQRAEEAIKRNKEAMDDRLRRIQEGLTDMDDCFMSQRSEELAIRKAQIEIEILKNGGVQEFSVLRSIDTGEVVAKFWYEGKWGFYWRILSEYEEKYGKYVGFGIKPETLAKKGLVKGKEVAPAWVRFRSNGSGMAGAYMATCEVYRSRKNYALEY